jgi:putative peptide zinc metalloprotease protein
MRTRSLLTGKARAKGTRAEPDHAPGGAALDESAPDETRPGEAAPDETAPGAAAASAEPAAASPVKAPLTMPVLADGTELVGKFKHSGYREPSQLVCLPNRQLVRLPTLLYLVVKTLDEHRHLDRTQDTAEALERVAEGVSRAAGVRITGEQVVYLVDRKLAPLGITSYSDGTPPPVVKADPFLGLRFKVAVLPERATWYLGGLFSWLFRPTVLVLMVAAILASEIWMFANSSLGDALRQLVLAPVNILLVMGLGILSCAFHEVGHATACRYSGVRPGAMGCGIYLVWPAFYTDVTESYRLGVAGRVRTDLAGVYFNGVFVVALTLLYLQTGFAPLLVAIIYVNLEMMQQLLPSLRFDGYYIISDLIGVPDLFKYIGPILRRTLLRRPADARLKELKRWPQVIVTLWVLTVLPALCFQLGLIATQIPRLLDTIWWMITRLASSATSGDAGTLEVITASLQILLLLLPPLGLMLILYQVGGWLVRKLVRYVQGPPVPEALTSP